MYLAGTEFRVFTDHRPLVGTFGRKNLEDTDNARLQRIMEKLAGYVFTVEWIPGKDTKIADALSRYPVFKHDVAEDTLDAAADQEIINRVRALQCHPDLAVEEIKICAKADTKHVSLTKALLMAKEPMNLPVAHYGRQFKSVWPRLSVDSDLVMLDSTRIIVPEALRMSILTKLHTQHAGITKTRLLAQSLYYWPGMTAAIKSMIDGCAHCQERLPSRPKEPEVTTTASRPMEALSVDLCNPKTGGDYLIIVDRYSGNMWFKRLSSTSTKAVISALEDVMLEHGHPSVIRTDGGPQFRSEFQNFCSNHKIKFEVSSAFNPPSNGHAE